jgi:hypothetical protein
MRKATKRRHWALLNPIEHAKYQAAKLTTAEWNAQMTPIVAALECIQRGEWDVKANWNPLFHCLNRIESMLHLKKVPDHGLIADCQRVFVQALKRRDTTGACALRADELATLREMTRTYGDLIREVSRADFQRAVAHTDANVNRIVNTRNTQGKTLHVNGALIELTDAPTATA